jgi:hypothetical protein
MDDKQREAIRKLLMRRTSENTSSLELAQKWLEEEGLTDEKGDLTPQYGGSSLGKTGR